MATKQVYALTNGPAYSRKKFKLQRKEGFVASGLGLAVAPFVKVLMAT
jgi:hypothetical protein